ncbi:MAG: endonuclease NucS [Anaerolineaceae bacterium]|nr:endonuclease NucS [Anaerolineaceae bacterium]
MKKLRLFHIADGQVVRQPASLFRYERELQDLLEQHLHDFLGVHFLAREFATDSGYIDTLGIDDDGRPVIIEYKRSMNQAVVVQGLDYLDWLMDRRADFRLLVLEKLGSERAQRIDWSPRLLIIASDYTDRQLRAVRRIHGIELLCYRRYGDMGFALEWVHGGEDEPVVPPDPLPDDPVPVPGHPDFPRYKNWDRTSEEVKALFRELLAFAQTLGEMRLDVFATQFSFRRMKGAEASLEWPPVFAQVRPNITTGKRIEVLERTQSTPPEEGFTTFIQYPSLYRVFIIYNRDDLEKAKPLLRESYERY